jgi:hypothetical protein
MEYEFCESLPPGSQDYYGLGLLTFWLPFHYSVVETSSSSNTSSNASTCFPVALTSTGIPLFLSSQDKAETNQPGSTMTKPEPTQTSPKKEDQPSGPASGSNSVSSVWTLLDCGHSGHNTTFSGRGLTDPGSSSGVSSGVVI